jgi:Cell wall-active antibiotics response 4TMS YvqF/Domain of unknown function (DUF1707)
MQLPESLTADLTWRPPATAERERVAAALCLHFAADHLGMEALEDRLSRVYLAQTPAQLQGLLYDLPPLDSDRMDAGDAALLAPSAVVPARGVLMAFMAGVVRKGSWLIPRELKVWAFMGGAEIDLREGKFAPGVTEIDITAFMGGVEIIVPHGVRVEVMGGAFMGGFETDAGDTAALDPSQPVLRVSGLAIMAGVAVKVRRPSKKMLKRFEAAVDAAKRLPSG